MREAGGGSREDSVPSLDLGGDWGGLDEEVRRAAQRAVEGVDPPGEVNPLVEAALWLPALQ